MPCVLSQDIRDRFVHYITTGHSALRAALVLKLSPSTGIKWAQRYRSQGSLTSKEIGQPRGSGKIAKHRVFLLELIEQEGDIILSELQGALLDAHNVSADISGIAKLLYREGYTHKKSRWWRVNAISPM